MRAVAVIVAFVLCLPTAGRGGQHVVTAAQIEARAGGGSCGD